MNGSRDSSGCHAWRARCCWRRSRLPWFRRAPACDGGRVGWRDGYAMAAAVERWGAAQRRGPWRGTWPASPVSLGEGLMTEVIDRLAAAVNAHDLDAVAGLIHEDY